MVPIGYVGAALAAVFAIVAAVAIVRGAGGLVGGAVGGWIVAALLSFTASFAQVWMPLILAGAALASMLLIGGVVRALVNAAGVGRSGSTVEEALPKAVPAAKTAAKTAGVNVTKPVTAKSAVTGSIAIVR
ncbi:hypothetical protein CQ040_03580 [Microbacterium sp. MYb54]|nr:hypothetical protein CQ032_04980 [Microbacterium sp. MYb43]PQZ75851.1 hypothetical protein CQ031_13670 [Microbacterium sp. MYb40]PRB23207.1 hypothetical protein CQ040_03580 [Microbacterium sp. MYb54]PRB28111.1 hypothetical protein CQ037_09920 [Microbacterium sp. MYb50]PRB66162.1 hypothetical protein CQ021_11625 [Microbacterium sp. MYb24]PRB74946.1 hypothetical protein CQ027_09660 [Microbacterium sp. MYb32]